jgi:hypothetical protein
VVGVPLGVIFKEIKSPATTDIEWLVSLAVVAASAMVQVKVVSAVFLRTIKAALLPAPGAVVNPVYNISMVPG